MDSGDEQISVDENYENEQRSHQGSEWEQSSLRTLASTVDSYTFENGRRYHAYRDTEYWAPNDDKNTEYEKVFNHLANLTLGDRLFLAPATRLGKVLDVGTGIGLWAFDFADQYEDAEITATDLCPSPQEPPRPNLKFECDDCCKEWTSPLDYYDFIHVRALYGAIRDWPAFYKECFDHTAPGGYLEQLEFSIVPYSDDGSVYPGSIWDQWAKLFAQAGDASGQTFYAFDGMDRLIAEAGYEDVAVRRFKLPLGKWPRAERLKEIGRWLRELWAQGIEAWLLRPAMGDLNWPRKRVDAFLEETRAALKNRNNHVYYHIHVVYGRKPLQ